MSGFLFTLFHYFHVLYVVGLFDKMLVKPHKTTHSGILVKLLLILLKNSNKNELLVI